MAGTHDSELNQIVAEDDDHLAFLTGYPTLLGTVLVAPKQHSEHVVRDLSEDAYLRIMAHCIAEPEARGCESFSHITQFVLKPRPRRRPYNVPDTTSYAALADRCHRGRFCSFSPAQVLAASAQN